MILSYVIKYRNINFFCYTIREVTVILQAPIANKPKYVKAMLR